MSTNINSFKNHTRMPPIDAGSYPAVCNGIIDLGVQITTIEGKIKNVPQILICWEFPEETDQETTKRRSLSRIFTSSINEGSKLRDTLKAWRGRDFTDEEKKDFDLKKFIGEPCIVTVTHKTKNKITYAEISGVTKIMLGQTVAQPETRLHFDTDDKSTWAIFPELPGWVRNKINENEDWKQLGIMLSPKGEAIERPSKQKEQVLSNNDKMLDGDLPF